MVPVHQGVILTNTTRYHSSKDQSLSYRDISPSMGSTYWYALSYHVSVCRYILYQWPVDTSIQTEMTNYGKDIKKIKIKAIVMVPTYIFQCGYLDRWILHHIDQYGPELNAFISLFSNPVNNGQTKKILKEPISQFCSISDFCPDSSCNQPALSNWW